MNRNDGSFDPSSTFDADTSSVFATSVSARDASETAANERAVFWPRRLIVRPSCIHSASCVVVCSFAETALPIVFAACTNRFKRRRAFFARRLSRRRSRFARWRRSSSSASVPFETASPSKLFRLSALCFSPSLLSPLLSFLDVNDSPFKNAAGLRITAAKAPEASEDRGERVGLSAGDVWSVACRESSLRWPPTSASESETPSSVISENGGLRCLLARSARDSPWFSSSASSPCSSRGASESSEPASRSAEPSPIPPRATPRSPSPSSRSSRATSSTEAPPGSRAREVLVAPGAPAGSAGPTASGSSDRWTSAG